MYFFWIWKPEYETRRKFGVKISYLSLYKRSFEIEKLQINVRELNFEFDAHFDKDKESLFWANTLSDSDKRYHFETWKTLAIKPSKMKYRIREQEFTCKDN